MSVVATHDCSQSRETGRLMELYSEFKEEELDARALAAQLQTAGLMQHWAAATGLPPPS